MLRNAITTPKRLAIAAPSSRAELEPVCAVPAGPGAVRHSLPASSRHQPDGRGANSAGRPLHGARRTGPTEARLALLMARLSYMLVQ